MPWDADAMIALINVTAVTGTTPSMTITIEGKDEDGAYTTLATLTAITAAGKFVLGIGDGTANLVELPPVIRFTFTITGTTPSFTFTVSAYSGRVGS